MTISKNARTALQQIRVCRISGEKTGRLLVPNQYIDLFCTVSERGGQIAIINEPRTDLPFDVLEIAHRQLNKPYFNRATPQDAPQVFSCSTFTKWVFAQIGIWLPRYSIDQSYVGNLSDRRSLTKYVGQLFFYRNRFPIEDPDRSIGHVAISIGDGTIIHGSAKCGKIAIEPIKISPSLIANPFPKEACVRITLPTKTEELETALDVARWLQR